MRTFLIPLAAFTIMSSCNKSTDQDDNIKTLELKMAPVSTQNEGEDNFSVGQASTSAEFPTVFNTDTSRKIIKKGDLRCRVKNVATARTKIVSAIKSVGGYISEETESGYENNRKEYSITLKVPAKNFDKLLQDISSTADNIDNKNIQIEDITSEYIDTKTRLDNKKKLEKRYLELLESAVKIGDMLQIENKLSEIRSDIESVERQFMQMKKQVVYSTITVNFYSQASASETGKGFLYLVGASLNEGLEYLGKAFFKILSFWPFVLILLTIFIFYKKRKRELSQ